jgi:AcrR family transcriptional regulator
VTSPPLDGGNHGDELPDGDPESVLRRAPFSDNPLVGVRGQRAQQRILEAALQVFGEAGYHQCGIARITDVAGCTRASFYQYFSSKEDVFRHLAGQVARQLMASAEALEPVNAEESGWKAVRAWLDRHAEIYARYQPVFEVFQIATETDDAVATGSARIIERHVAIVRARVAGSAVAPRQLDAVIEQLLNCVTRAPRLTEVLRSAVPGRALDQARMDDALTDLIHRTLFGPIDGVNVRPAPRAKLARVRHGAKLLAGLQVDASADELTAAGARTLESLLEASHAVLVERGYHGTRVDDIAAAAGLSHGAFYRYFENKDHLVRLLAARALQRVSADFDEIPDVAGALDATGLTALRRWLRRYAGTHASEAALIRVWVEATADDAVLSLESAAALDWGRARMARFLAPRGFGDVEAEALLLVVLLDAIGARPSAPAIDAAAQVIEHGLLGATRS